jgi:Trypsin-like peptidase domain
MKVDWERPASPHRGADGVRVAEWTGAGTAGERTRNDGSLAERGRAVGAARGGAGVRAAASVRSRRGRREEEGDRRRAFRLVKLNAAERPEQFTFAEHAGLEAVILTGGERPSVVVQNGFVDLGAPDLGDWADRLRQLEAQVRKVIGSVGRIDIPVKPNFAGTCFVAAEGFAVTNRHVAELIAVQGSQGAWTLRWPEATWVDFGGEQDGAPGPRFNGNAIDFAGPDPIKRNIDFTHLDMAVLRLEGGPGARMPEPVTFEADKQEPASEREVYLVGFPAEPFEWLFGGKPPAGYETTEVLAHLFGGSFGIKRLAPGKITRGPGELPNDPKKWICAHDSSTLGGNSGSCIVDLGVDGLRVLGLHFGGVARGQNWGALGGQPAGESGTIRSAICGLI